MSQTKYLPRKPEYVEYDFIYIKLKNRKNALIFSIVSPVVSIWGLATRRRLKESASGSGYW